MCSRTIETIENGREGPTKKCVCVPINVFEVKLESEKGGYLIVETVFMTILHTVCDA